MRKKHGVKEREEAVRRCLAGKSVKLVSKELCIKDHYIYEWVERYKMYGREGLENSRITSGVLRRKEKEHIIMCE